MRYGVSPHNHVAESERREPRLSYHNQKIPQIYVVVIVQKSQMRSLYPPPNLSSGKEKAKIGDRRTDGQTDETIMLEDQGSTQLLR